MVIFRADANHHIGMGHIMRCLSIADSFSSKGNSVVFVLADEKATQVVKERGYTSIVLHSKYDNMEEELSLWESLVFRTLSYSNIIDRIVVDSYYVSSQYLVGVKSLMDCYAKNGKLIYIDDIAAFPYPVDILINYNSYASALVYEKLYCEAGGVISIPQMVLGPKYVPLRSMFKNLKLKQQPPKVKNVLFSTGGADEFHLTLKILEYLDNSIDNLSSVLKGLNYHFLLGAMNGDKNNIAELVENKPYFFTYEKVADMRNLIGSMDLVVSAAGSTLYEICACGVPLITCVMADNQFFGAESFEKMGLAENIGDIRSSQVGLHKRKARDEINTEVIEEIIKAIENLAMDLEKRQTMGLKMQRLIDGYGADRIVEILGSC